MTKTADRKRRLRRLVRDRLRAIPDDRRRAWDHEIQRQVLAHPAYRDARWVHCYLGQPDEVSTEAIVRAALAGTKQVAVPVVDQELRCLAMAQIDDYDRELAPGYCGILEPPAGARRLVDAAQIDLFLVPGMAFDARGYRLGRGLGYYDRCLAAVKGRATIGALAYELQMAERLPTARHDVPVDLIFTEKRVIEVKGG